MSTLADTLRAWAEQPVVTNRRAQASIGVAAFVLATSFGAHVAVPLPGHVPLTLQVLFVILSGVVLGPFLGATAMALYLAVGAAGAPVFSGGGAGLLWLAGPTGGYLIAMPAAAFVTGWVAGREPGFPRLLAGLVLGVAIIYAGGVSQLYLLTRQGPGTLFAVGVLPFLAVDATKIGVALLLARLIRFRR